MPFRPIGQPERRRDGRHPGADSRSGAAIIYYSRSTDAGATWSPAAQLAPPGVNNTYQVEPWVSTEEDGTFHTVWYDEP